MSSRSYVIPVFCVSSKYICVRSRDCLVTWFCYQMIAKPGNKTGAPSCPDPYMCTFYFLFYLLVATPKISMGYLFCWIHFRKSSWYNATSLLSFFFTQLMATITEASYAKLYVSIDDSSFSSGGSPELHAACDLNGVGNILKLQVSRDFLPILNSVIW